MLIYCTTSCTLSSSSFYFGFIFQNQECEDGYGRQLIEVRRNVPQVYKELTLRMRVCYIGENSCVLKNVVIVTKLLQTPMDVFNSFGYSL